jgi:hypothetical protein
MLYPNKIIKKNADWGLDTGKLSMNGTSTTGHQYVVL